ncbi:hypothetical protein IKG68_00275 [Candidatus Saccharibacteria bacterium]|nr:hypothetical protein [Candidatus Saccharibacteria bacterium]
MKKRNLLKLKIGLGFAGLGIAVIAITSAITPWSAFHSRNYTGVKDSRFVYYGNYEDQSSAYRYSVYSKLKSPDSTSAASADSSNTAKSTTESSTESATENTSSANAAFNTTVTDSPASTATDAMAGITIAEADGSPYTRSDYGTGWDVSELICNIRATILNQTSLVAAQTASNGCTVIYGSWVDPYSGAVLTGNPYQGDGTANDLDIDHVIPLKYVNSHGGYYWSASAKVAYGKSVSAMYNGVYLAVSASENRKKGDSGPADYYPSNPAFYCEYSRMWRDTARQYSISLSLRDYNKIKGVLAECNIN